MPDKAPRAGAAVLLEKDGKYLLGRRNKENASGKWIIPGGGIDWGETAQQAAKREIQEETGITAEIVRLICVKEIIATEANYHSIVFFYLGKPIAGTPSPKDDLSEVRYFTAEQARKLDTVRSVQEVFEELGLF